MFNIFCGLAFLYYPDGFYSVNFAYTSVMNLLFILLLLIIIVYHNYHLLQLKYELEFFFVIAK